MNRNIIVSIILTAVIVGGGAFYGGMKYQAGKGVAGINLQNLSSDQRQQMMQQFRNGAAGNASGGAAARSGQQGTRNGSNFTSGDIISKDDKSITIKLRAGGSQIVFFASSTPITKSASGSASDLEVGKTVMVTGKTNSDGSLTADTVQLR